MIVRSEDLERCREIAELHGTSYYAATRFFPRKKREATWVLYAFFRLPDEYVDRPEGAEDPSDRLMAFRAAWQQAYVGNLPSDDTLQSSVLRAAASVFHAYAIPPEFAEAFLDAMIQDTWKDRYETYVELEGYMYGSAAVVGLMMTHVIGFTDPKALVHARQLGEAMQLTNFLRDVGEDMRERGRIYLPQEDLTRFGVTETTVKEGRVSDAWKQLLAFETARARALYRSANEGISLLSPDGRFAVCAAGTLYAAILRKIEQNHSDVFTKRARTTVFEKGTLLLKTAMSKRILV